jgi:hypothetical protein
MNSEGLSLHRLAFLAVAVCLFLALESCAAHSDKSVPVAQQSATTVSDLEQLAAKVAVTTLARTGQHLQTAPGIAIPSYLEDAISLLISTPRKPAAIATSESANLFAIAGVPVLISSSKRASAVARSLGSGLCYYRMYYHVDDDGTIEVDGVEFIGCDDGYVPQPDPGGSGSSPAPSPAPIPNSTTGCANGGTKGQNVRNTAEKQVNDHLPMAISRGQEWAGFVYSDSLGNLVSVGAWYSVDPVTGGAISFPSTPPAYDGWTVEAWFHDHDTDYSLSDDPSGVQGAGQVPVGQPYSGNYFSADDENYSNSNSLDGYVGLKNDGGNEWAEWTAGGTVGQQDNYTNHAGLGSGC